MNHLDFLQTGEGVLLSANERVTIKVGTIWNETRQFKNQIICNTWLYSIL